MKKLTKRKLQEIKNKAKRILAEKDLPFSVERCYLNRENMLDFEIEHEGYDGVTFDMLCRVSEIFGTKDINVTSEYIEGCSTCGGETDYSLHVMNVTLDFLNLTK